jgi:peptidoglycan biosynthesis protein MviN/MurJ (putative lipid II flippase)
MGTRCLEWRILARVRDPVKPGPALDAYGLAVLTLIAVIAEWAVVLPWLKKQPVRS